MGTITYAKFDLSAEKTDDIPTWDAAKHFKTLSEETQKAAKVVKAKLKGDITIVVKAGERVQTFTQSATVGMIQMVILDVMPIPSGAPTKANGWGTKVRNRWLEFVVMPTLGLDWEAQTDGQKDAYRNASIVALAILLDTSVMRDNAGKQPDDKDFSLSSLVKGGVMFLDSKKLGKKHRTAEGDTSELSQTKARSWGVSILEPGESSKHGALIKQIKSLTTKVQAIEGTFNDAVQAAARQLRDDLTEIVDRTDEYNNADHDDDDDGEIETPDTDLDGAGITDEEYDDAATGTHG